MSANSVSDDAPFLVHSQHLLAVTSHSGRARELFRVSFIRALIPFMRAVPS